MELIILCCIAIAPFVCIYAVKSYSEKILKKLDEQNELLQKHLNRDK